MKRVGEWIRTTPAEGYIGTSAAIPTIDVTARLGEIGIPCLALVGADDIAISNIEQPEAFNQAVAGFHEGIL